MQANALQIYFVLEFNFKAMVVSYYIHAVLNSLAKQKINAIDLL
jgi:ribosome-associated toxin RatA of RatAB toxin-antitoxin module